MSDLVFHGHNIPNSQNVDSVAVGPRGIYHVKSSHNHKTNDPEFDVYHISHGKTSEYIGTHKTRSGAIGLATKHHNSWNKHDEEHKSSQHSEEPEVEQFSESDALRHLSKFGYKYKGEEKATGQQLYNHDNGHGVSVSKGGKDWYHHGPKGTNIVHGSGYNKLVSHLKSYHSSQHSEQPEVEQFGDEEHVKGIYHGSVAMVPGDKRRSKFKNLVEQHGGHLNAYDQIYLPKKNLQEFHKSASASEFRHGLGKSNHYHIPQDSQHSEQEEQPDRSYTEHLMNGGKPFIQRHVAEVVQYEEEPKEEIDPHPEVEQFASHDNPEHGDYPKSGYVEQKRDYENHADVYKHPETGHEIRIHSSRTYKKFGKTGRLRNPSGTKQSYSVSLNGKEHAYHSAVGENHEKEKAARQKINKHLKKHFGIEEHYKF